MNGAIVALHRAVLDLLEAELYEAFLSSPEVSIHPVAVCLSV